jgi:Glycoside hydrolase 123, catalytic domain
MFEENSLKRMITICLAVFFLNASARAQTAHAVWAVSDGEKIERDELNSPHKRGNAVWDGKRVKLFGARNEIIAFQLIVEAGASGIRRLSAALPELSLKGGRRKIVYRAPGDDPSQTVGRPIQLFAANYLNVTQATGASWFYKSAAAKPSDPVGWKPVQLAPENASRGGFPLAVAPQRNQAIWIEIYTARNLPSGAYRGHVTVQADGEQTVVPVELELFDFTLPDENSLPAMVYYERSQPELYQGRNLDAEYHRFAHRNRIELVHAYSVEAVNAAAGRFGGADFTAAKGYEGPGEGVGNRIVPATFYGPGKEFDDRAGAWRKADEWMTFLKERLPRAITFLYLPDEPSPRQFAYIRQLADNVHSNPGPGRALRTMVTHDYVKELDDSIDIWNASGLWFDIRRAEAERAKGRQYWTYNGGRPAVGALLIDTPATDARVIPWACFKHGVEVYFQWHGVHWRHNSQKQGERNQNVWANPVTFDNRGQPNKPINDQNFANGDGVLLYPGEERLHPEENRGVAGPISTVQLANLRRGLQDHLYLTMARKLGLNADVEAALRTIVPRVFSDAGDQVGFAETGDAFEAARYQLAKAIAAKGRK